MDRILFVVQTIMLSIAGGVASAFSGLLIAFVISVLVFFVILLHHAFTGGGVYMDQVVPIARSAFSVFTWLAVAGALLGFVIGAATVVSDRTRL